MITDRQREILIAIIKEFMTSADEVGSTTLLEKYDMDVSSATIRNEMVRLMNEGFLEKSHISSGRMPTDQAIRLYVREVISRPTLSAVDEALVKQELFRVRFAPEELINEILSILVKESQSAAFVFMDDMSRYYGVSSLMKYEELRSVEILQRVLDVLEDRNLLNTVFNKFEGDEVSLLIGSESGIHDLENCTIAFTKLSLRKRKDAHMGVIGSRRLNYSRVVPLLKAVRESVENSLKGWR